MNTVIGLVNRTLRSCIQWKPSINKAKNKNGDEEGEEGELCKNEEWGRRGGDVMTRRAQLLLVQRVREIGRNLQFRNKLHGFRTHLTPRWRRKRWRSKEWGREGSYSYIISSVFVSLTPIVAPNRKRRYEGNYCHLERRYLPSSDRKMHWKFRLEKYNWALTITYTRLFF